LTTGHYSVFDDSALAFYLDYGWVVIDNMLPRRRLDQMRSTWRALCEACAAEIGCGIEPYDAVISQWRDLWKQQAPFGAALADPLATLASRSLQADGVRLLHDHIICKRGRGANGLIPWHQDSMFWPVDRTGLSTWTPFDPVGTASGCLEVISGSHRWPPSPPVDFMHSAHTPADAAGPQALPVAAGATVLLHSRTWHRSRATRHEAARPVYIALWVPIGTHYHPDNAAWHPLNEQITVAAGEYLNNDEFPLFGNPAPCLGNSDANCFEHPPTPRGMFNAGQRTTQQVAQLLGGHGSLAQLLASGDQRRRLVDILVRSGIDRSAAGPTVEQLWIAASAFELHRARDVFNHAYTAWEALFSGHNGVPPS